MTYDLDCEPKKIRAPRNQTLTIFENEKDILLQKTISLSEEYCQFATKRLEMADNNMSIQGYLDGYFWERNSKIVNI